MQLELGGKDPVYVCDDVDVGTAAASIADGAFYNTGQSCCSVERIYVHEKIYDAFVRAFVAEVKGFKMGDPAAETTYIGAITRRPQLEVLEKQVADATKRGAKLLTGGNVVRQKATGSTDGLRRRQSHDGVDEEESFGPIIGIQKVKDDAELALMNDSEYGLTAGWHDQPEARGILAQVRSVGLLELLRPGQPALAVVWRGPPGIGWISTYGIATFTPEGVAPQGARPAAARHLS